MQIMITGASGFIATHLIVELLERFPSCELKLVYRNPQRLIQHKRVVSLAPESIPSHPCDVVINLAGAGLLDWPWTDTRRQEIKNSRISFTTRLAKMMSESWQPKLFIQASAIGYYGMSPRHHTAKETEPAGIDWAGELCSAWENASLACPAQRRVIMRLGVVLDPRGGAMARMLPFFKLGMGAVIGSGSQQMAWISLHDVIKAICWSIENEHINGIYNLTAKDSITNREWTLLLAKHLHRPAWLSIPTWALKLVFQEGAQLLTVGVGINSDKIREAGFEFTYDSMENFLRGRVL